MDADASGNGEIDAADYVVWRHAVEQTAPNNVSVPEPTNLLVLGIALVAGLSLRRYHSLSTANGEILGERVTTQEGADCVLPSYHLYRPLHR